MTLAITGTGTTTSYTAGNKVKPFSTTNILNSLANNRDSESVTITISDIKTGQPTDSDGSFALPYYLKHTAPGVYVMTEPGGYIDRDIKGLTFTTGNTATTALITLAVVDTNNQTATDSHTNIANAVPPTSFVIADQTSGITYVSNGTPYSGTLGFSNQYVVQTDAPALAPDNLNISAITPNTFIHSGSGTDAINVSGAGGKNVLDGSTGSNFLVGGRAGTGTDTFFLDDRGPAADIFSTIVNFHAGDVATIFGISPATATLTYADNQGATGYTGLTLHATRLGAPTASLTLAGYTTADLGNGRLGVSFGTEPDGTSYIAISGVS